MTCNTNNHPHSREVAQSRLLWEDHVGVALMLTERGLTEVDLPKLDNMLPLTLARLIRAPATAARLLAARLTMTMDSGDNS